MLCLGAMFDAFGAESDPVYKAFRAALADAFLRVDRFPDAPWTTDALLYAFRQALDDLLDNENVSRTEYLQARAVQDDIALAIKTFRDLTTDR